MAHKLAVQGALPARPRRVRQISAVGVRLLASLLAALALLYLFSRLIDLGAVLPRITHLNLELALLCGLAFLGASAVRALRWRCILAPRPVKAWRAVAIYQVAGVANWLVPVHSGELVKSLLLKQHDGIPISESLPAVAMDKLMDLLPVVGLLIAAPFLPVHLDQSLWLVLVLISTMLGIGALVLAIGVWQQRAALALLHRALEVLPETLRRRVGPLLVNGVDSLLKLVARPRVLLLATAYTVVAVCLDALFPLFAFAAVGVFVSFPLILFGDTLFNLAFILPTPPGHLGSSEVLGLLIFAYMLHLSKAGVAVGIVFMHAASVVLMLGFGLICLSALGLTPHAVLGILRRPTEAAIADEARADAP